MGAGEGGVGHQIRALPPPGANTNYMQPPAFSVFFSFRKQLILLLRFHSTIARRAIHHFIGTLHHAQFPAGRPACTCTSISIYNCAWL